MKVGKGRCGILYGMPHLPFLTGFRMLVECIGHETEDHARFWQMAHKILPDTC